MKAVVLTLAVLFLTGRCPQPREPTVGVSLLPEPLRTTLLGPGSRIISLPPSPLPSTSAWIPAQSWSDLGLPSLSQGARLGISGSMMTPSHPGIG